MPAERICLMWGCNHPCRDGKTICGCCAWKLARANASLGLIMAEIHRRPIVPAEEVETLLAAAELWQKRRQPETGRAQSGVSASRAGR